MRGLFSRELGVYEDDFDYELDKAHGLPINPTESTRRNSPPNIICKFRTHRFKEQLCSQKKKIHRSTNRKINFHVSLTKHRSDLLQETNNYIKNDDCIKFYFPDSNGNFKVKFAGNQNVSFDTFQSFLTVLERKQVVMKTLMKGIIMLRQLKLSSNRPVPFCLFTFSTQIAIHFLHVSEALFRHSMILPFLF